MSGIEATLELGMSNHDEAIARLSRDEIAAGIASGRPFLVENGVAHWPAAKLWTLDFLAERLQGRPVPLSSTSDAEFTYSPSAPTFAIRREPFEVAVEKVRAPAAEGERVLRHFLIQMSIPDALPELAPDVLIPDEIPIDDLLLASLWMGAKGCVTPLHYDNSNNLYAQIRGRKRWRLFAPEETHRLYPHSVEATYRHISQVDLLKPDLVSFPRLADARGLDVTAGEGDLLFIPAYWWHHVESLDVAISVSFWWKTTIEQCLVPNALRLLLPAWRLRLLPQIKMSLGCTGKADDEPGGLVDMARKLRSRGFLWPAVVAGGTALMGRLIREPSMAKWGPVLARWGPILDAAGDGDDARLEPGDVDELIAAVS